MSEDKTRILTAEEAARLAALAEPADDKTRVLSAEDAARMLGEPQAAPRSQPVTEDREPKFIGSKIVFFCSNGHKITVSRSQAGKHGKCQGMAKQGCGAPFVVPIPPDFEPAIPAPRPDAEPAADFDAPDPEQSLDLGAIPPAGLAPAPGPAGPALDFAAGGSAAADDPAVDFGVGPEATGPDWALDIDSIDNPTARLVARLWLERAHGGIVEVHLSGGSVIMPDFFDPGWSCGTHALFATPGPGETVTLTAVAWDQIQKVVVRQVQGKPDGMFEG